MLELLTLYTIGLMGSVVPGPDILYITRTTLDRGLWAGWIGASGVLFASLFYLTAAGLGLGVLGQSPYFQLPIGIFGSLYLLWIAKSIWNETIHLDNRHDRDGHKLHIFLKRDGRPSLQPQSDHLFLHHPGPLSGSWQSAVTDTRPHDGAHDDLFRSSVSGVTF